MTASGAASPTGGGAPDGRGAAQDSRALAERLGASALTLTVEDVGVLTPAVRRVRLESPELVGFDHRPGQDLMVAVPDSADRSGQATFRRRYTIRRLDRRRGTVDLDIVIHGDGPGARWAGGASPGERVSAVGPRGKVTVVADADWHLFAGDESALPGIAAMVESLDAGATALVLLEVEGPDERQPVSARDGVDLGLQWLDRGGAEPGTGTGLADALAAVDLPPGRGHAYLAGELRVVGALRARLVARGLEAAQLSPKPYWRRGVANAPHGEPASD